MSTALRMLHITSCRDPLMWYANRVGQFVPLTRRLPEGGWQSREPAGYSNIVHKLDAEEVTVTVPRSKMGHWPYIEPLHKLIDIAPKGPEQRLAYRPQDMPPVVKPSFTTEPACQQRCDMLGVCRGLPDCEEALGMARARAVCMTGPAKPAQTGQSHRASAIEAATNIVLGFGISVGITAVLLPAFGHQVTLSENVAMTCVFTVASFARAYGLRRLFNWLHTRAAR